MIRYILIFVCLIPIFATSCYRDLGSYDYTSIDSVRIENVLKEYPDMIMFEDTLKIFPKVTHREGKFSYKWCRLENGEKFELISEGMDLIYPIVHAGSNSLYFFVKDEEYGLETWVSTSCMVRSMTSQGLFVLKEVEGENTDVDLFLSVSEVYPDLLKNKFGHPMIGEPKALDYWGYQWADYENDTIVRIPTLRVGSENDLWVINTRNFDRVMSLDSMFLDEKPTTIKVNGFQSVSGMSVLTYNDGRCRIFDNTTGSRFLPELMGDYSLGVDMSSRYRGFELFVFDQLTGTFHHLNETGTKLRNHNKAVVKGIPVKNTGKEMVFMGSAKMSYGLSLLKNKVGERDTLFLYKMSYDRSSAANLTSAVVDTIKEGYMYRAKLYSFHKDQDFFYFTCDEGDHSVVYCYDMKKKEEKEVWRSTEGRITHLQYVNEYYAAGLLSPVSPKEMKLVVSTHQNGKYKIHYFRTVASNLEALDEVYEGVGVVKKIIRVKEDSNPIWLYYVNN